ncbi:carboxylate-amine ligase [Labrys sp. (in: a-proteobacteria)]|uniref:carboxylate-amine ligase n=1 Tax=Labrys sp. (in: a-proteobacteria) TaxID=1917972 RepID=UPI0039E4AA28
MEHPYTFGIEEEYFVFQRRTGAVQETMSAQFFDEARQMLGKHVTRELLQSQIEIATTPCRNMKDARLQLVGCRQALQDLAFKHDLGILAAGTHPSAEWSEQHPTQASRYGKVTRDLQMLARRKMICGMHVHVEIPQEHSRVDLMTRMLPYLPLLLALSTSSPFWQARPTGLMGYRQNIYAELPRSGLPDLFRSEEDYRTYVDTLVSNRIIDDASFLWWAIRPSSHLPTLELRITDVCTNVEDALAIAALYRSLVRYLSRKPDLNRGLTSPGRAIVEENKWRAQRYGIHGSLIDLHSGQARSAANMLTELLDLVWEDAELLGCSEELATAQMILRTGTSADGQLAVYEERIAAGATAEEAIRAVVSWLADRTAAPLAAGLAASG